LVSRDDQPNAIDEIAALKGLTHLEISTQHPISLWPLKSTFTLRSIQITGAGAVEDLSALDGLPALHEVRLGNYVDCDRIALAEVLENRTPWDIEFKAENPKATPSLGISVVSDEEFHFFNTKASYGIEPGECECGMFHSEKHWLFTQMETRLQLDFEHESDFTTPDTCGGFRRSGGMAIYTLRAYESFRQIVNHVQEVLCSSRKPWIVYFQSLLAEGPDADDLPEGVEDFTVWIYPDKIMATKENAEIVGRLLEFR
jgi:hypothetical protein